MREEIRSSLIELSEEKYRDFSSALIPGSSKQMLGIRLPRLRACAKEIAKGDWQKEVASFENEYEDIYFEETMLRGMIIGYGTQKKDSSVEEGLYFLEKIIPHIDNWSICDSFCVSFGFAAKHRDEVWDFIQKYLYSDKEFEIRVGIILLLAQYLKYDVNGKKVQRKREILMADFAESAENCKRAEQNKKQCPYLEKIFAVLNRPFPQGYYAQMAAAWTTAEAFIMFPYETHQMLTANNAMDKWTYNKTIQKICESRNPDAEVKQYMKGFKKT